MSWLDDIFSNVPSLSDLTSGRNVLDSAVARLQARIGVFLQQKQRLMTLETRAGSLSRIDKTAQQSLVLMSRTKALEQTQVAIENDAMSQLAAANAIKSELQTDPIWQQLSSASWSNLGTAPLQKVQTMLQRLSATASALGSLLQRINAHIDNVDKLEDDIVDAESYASGKGLLSLGEEVAGSGANFYQSLMGKPLMIFAAVAGVAIFWPSIAEGTAAALRPRNNPKRGRRR